MAETGEIMLFGVRVVIDAMRKSVSLNNLTQYEHRADFEKAMEGIPIVVEEALPSASATGYASADEAAHLLPSRGERKRGVAWTEEEHKLFLLGLKKVGKGDWRGISRNFVKTRTPTQVASHAQKYFLRRVNVNRRRRRTSLFDITTESLPAIHMENQENCAVGKNMGGIESPLRSSDQLMIHVEEEEKKQSSSSPFAASILDLNLKLSLSNDRSSRKSSFKRYSNKPKSIISVA